MPKMKTTRGAANRFSKTGSGRFKHRQSFRNHILTKKPTKRMRHLRGMKLVHESDQRTVRRLLPNP